MNTVMFIAYLNSDRYEALDKEQGLISCTHISIGKEV